MLARVKDFVHGNVKIIAADKGVFYPSDSPVTIQLEQLFDQSYLFYCSFARDGSGLFMVPFTSLLLTEDIHAFTTHPTHRHSELTPPAISCVAGSVSVTYFTRFSADGLSVRDIADHLEKFTADISERYHEFADNIIGKVERLKTANLAECRLTHLIHQIDE